MNQCSLNNPSSKKGPSRYSLIPSLCPFFVLVISHTIVGPLTITVDPVSNRPLEDSSVHLRRSLNGAVSCSCDSINRWLGTAEEQALEGERIDRGTQSLVGVRQSPPIDTDTLIRRPLATFLVLVPLSGSRRHHDRRDERGSVVKDSEESTW